MSGSSGGVDPSPEVAINKQTRLEQSACPSACDRAPPYDRSQRADSIQTEPEVTFLDSSMLIFAMKIPSPPKSQDLELRRSGLPSLLPAAPRWGE